MEVHTRLHTVDLTVALQYYGEHGIFLWTILDARNERAWDIVYMAPTLLWEDARALLPFLDAHAGLLIGRTSLGVRVPAGMGQATARSLHAFDEQVLSGDGRKWLFGG